MSHSVTSRAWWLALAQRVTATVLSALIAVLPAVVMAQMSLREAGLWLGLTVVATVVTALASMPEVDGTKVPLWKAILVRSLRTLGQTLAAGIGSTVLLTDVDWAPLLISAGLATALTLLRTILMALPESATTGLIDHADLR